MELPSTTAAVFAFYVVGGALLVGVVAWAFSPLFGNRWTEHERRK